MQKPLAIYIHWPFCKKKCPYCDFNSHVRQEVDHARYAKALVKELSYYHNLLPDHQVSSVFFGGGTPSLMQPETVQACLSMIHDHWDVVDNLEVTLEANPTSSEAQKFEGFAKAGVNRLSIGVQSLDDAALSFLGREHSAGEAIEAIHMARSIFKRNSFDLIYGRPEQTLEAWEGELGQALALKPDHISLYQLTIEQGTEFATLYKRKAFLMPSDDLEADFYDVTQSVLAKAGLPAYEISNHARKGQESRHNLSYWRYQDYIGIGAGAHGRFVDAKGQRIATRGHKAPEVWLERVEVQGHGGHPVEEISPEQSFDECLMMGLRLVEGIEFCDVLAKTGTDPLTKLDSRKLKQLEDEGYLLYSASQGMKCTQTGLKTLNSLLAYLLA